MKVLFAVNNDDISNAILKKYQKNYKEILSYKNVYYFNAILKELQKDKTYDRVVISEDLEPFANNNYDTIDKFLFDKLDNISDEATNAEGNDTDIILICTDRRSKSDEMLTKLFGIGIYSAIVGQDRSIEEVCKLINKPRTKKDAKLYYKIETENVSYQVESEDSVSEAEVQNIIAHYKRLGKNEDKYVDSFNNIVSQYTDTQLKIIIRYLPIGVKAVLEERSPKYQELVSFEPKTNPKKAQFNNYKEGKKVETNRKEDKIKVKMLEDESNKINITRPIVIPEGVNTSQVKRLIKQEKPVQEAVIPQIEEEDISAVEKEKVDVEVDSIQEPVLQEKRGRGRPRKNPVPVVDETQDKPKRGRGRPRKNPVPVVDETQDESDELIDLFNLDDDDEIENNIKNKERINSEDEIDLFNLHSDDLDNNSDISSDEESIDLFSLDDDDIDNSAKKVEEINNQEESIDLFNLDDDKIENNIQNKEIINDEEEIDLFNMEKDEDGIKYEPLNSTKAISDTQYKPMNSEFNTLLTKDKKVVSFVGTTKNGTSFVVNNAAHMLASMGISTAILDMTKTRNAYYIYTNSEEHLMKTAKDSIYKLRSGIADGVKINKNLTVYTSLPEDDGDYSDVEAILGTLVRNYSVVLIDCDFDTPMEYFGASQEIYLVQSMDVLTIQPLTAFLRNLQSRGVLKQEKIKIVINKGVKIKSVPIKTLIGGISKYNDPSMTYMKDLFDKDKVNYCVIPFEVPNYIKYLDSLITCSITLNGYTKPFISALKELCNMIYPLINRQTYSPRGDKYQDSFSNEMNNTLNKMKRKYQ